MRLVVLYGPPGVGKLTVARELATRLGLPLVHNHLVVDLASALFPVVTREYSDLARALRRSLLDGAAAGGAPGLVTTFAFGVETFGGEDAAELRDLKRRVEDAGGRVTLVKLTCRTEVHRARVASEERRATRKLSDPEALGALAATRDLDGVVDPGTVLVLDTSDLAPAEAADRIAAAIGS